MSLLRALEVSLDGIFAEGLPERYERHRRVAAMVRDGMGELGFEPLTDTASLAPTFSVLALPEGVDDADAARRDDRARGGDRGMSRPWAGRGIRIGHMGTATEAEAARTIDAAAAVTGRPCLIARLLETVCATPSAMTG